MILIRRNPEEKEQEHDIFFGIAVSFTALISKIQTFFPESNDIHIEAWRQVTLVDGYKITILPKTVDLNQFSENNLFFINLGGYQPERFEEQHYMLLTVKKNKAAAARKAHEEKYGIELNDFYEIEKVLSASQKGLFTIHLTRAPLQKEDTIHLKSLKISISTKPD